MKTEPLTIAKIITKDAVIINHDPPTKDITLQLEITRKFEKASPGFKTFLSVSVYKESEKEIEDKSFLVKYALEAHFSNVHTDLSIENLQNSASIMLFPYIRAGISAFMGAAGLEPIQLPLYSID